MDNKNKKNERGLGRGLGSLLGGSADSGMMGRSFEKEASSAPKKNVDTQVASLNTQIGVQVIKGTTKDLNDNKQVLKNIQPSEKVLVNDSSPMGSVATVTPVESTPADLKNKVWMIPIDKLNQGQYQPRKDFHKEPLQELAQSIKENGILQPIIVRKVEGGKFEIVAGERRWRASQLAGLHEVPAIIKEFSDQKTLELAIIENVQREDLNPIEEAEAYMKLSEEFSLSQQQIAEKVGKDRTTVANALRLLVLPKIIQNMVVQKEISVGHAKVLLSLPDVQKQIELAKQCVAEKLSVRKLEKRVAEAISQKAQALKPQSSDESSSVTQKLIQGLAEELQKILSTKVEIDYKNSKGKLVVHFYSDDELTQLVDRIKK